MSFLTPVFPDPINPLTTNDALSKLWKSIDLTALNFDGNWRYAHIGHNFLTHILANPTILPALASLRITNCPIHASTFSELLRWVRQKNVTHLSLESNELKLGRAIFFPPSTAIPWMLQELYMSHNELRDLGVMVLTTAFSDTTTLCSLFLSSNQITDLGAYALDQFARSHPSLHTLHLRGNELTDTTGVMFALLLLETTSLRTLDLASNQIGDVGALALAEVLEFNTTLTDLSLVGNDGITDKINKQFAFSLLTNTSITALDLNRDEEKASHQLAMGQIDAHLHKNKTLRNNQALSLFKLCAEGLIKRAEPKKRSIRVAPKPAKKIRR